MPIASHLTKIQVMKYRNEVVDHPWREVTCYPVFSTFKRTAKSSSSFIGSPSPPIPPRRESSRKNSRLERWTKDVDAESSVELKIFKTRPETTIKRAKSASLKSVSKTCASDSKKEKDKSVKVNIKTSTRGKHLARSSTLSTNSSESSLLKKTKSLSTPARTTPVSKMAQKTISREKSVSQTSSLKTNGGKRQSKKIEIVESTVKSNLKREKTNKTSEKQNEFGEEFFQQLLLTDEKKTQKTNPTVAEKKPDVVKRKESKIDVYLSSKKPVSRSKFKSYDQYQCSGITEWDQFGDDSVDYLKGRSASEPPSRSPSSRRIRSFQAPVRLIESVTGVVRRCQRSKSAEEPIERVKNAAADYEYQTYVRELRHSSKKSERFKELHNFYCSLERLAELEKTAEKASNKVRARGDLVDYDKWKTIRVKERAESEIKSLQAKLENVQKSKDVLYKTKDPEDIRWKGNLDRGLRNRETSVGDLKRKFHALGNDNNGYRIPEANVYRPLWRGTSVQDVANSLKNITSSKRGRPVSEPREKRYASVPRRPSSKSPTDIGRRIWSSLSMEQLNRLKTQLNEVYSTISDLKGERTPRFPRANQSTTDYEVEVKNRVKRSEMSSSLYIRSSSTGPAREKDRDERLRKADSIGSVCLSENEKKKISKNIGLEVLERKNKKHSAAGLVIPKETLGAVAARKCRRTDGAGSVSPRTCYSMDVSEEESVAKSSSDKHYLLVLADDEDKRQMVSDWANNGAANVSESSSSASTVIHLGAKRTANLHSSQSFSSMKCILGESECTRSVLSPPFSDRPCDEYYPTRTGGTVVRRLRRQFESFDDVRFLHSPPAGRAAAKRYKSDTDLHTNVVIKRHEHGDVQTLKHRYERRFKNGPVVIRCPLRSDNRLMPRINVISKMAGLRGKLNEGEVERIRTMFENKHRAFMLGQFYTSTPDLREARKMISYLDCDWLAHRYPEPEPSWARPRTRPKSASPVRRNRKQQHHHPSILKRSRHDSFLSQPYNPEAHKPKYRWTPAWNGVWTQQPTLPPKPSVVKFEGYVRTRQYNNAHSSAIVGAKHYPPHNPR